MLAGQQAGQPGRDPPRRPGPGGGGQGRQPGRHRGRVVVDDLVDAGGAPLQGGERGRGGVVDVDERAHAGTRADHREAAPAEVVEHVAALPGRGPGAVEAAVAQDDPLQVLGPEHGRLEVPDGVQGAPQLGRRVGVERVVLGLDRPADPGERPPGEALGDEPAGPGGPRRLQQVVGALDAQAVGGGEPLVELAEVGDAGQVGELVHHRIGAGGRDRRQHRVPVEGVGDHRLGPGRVQVHGPAHPTGHGGHLMAVRDQQRHQPAAQRPGRPGDEHPHGRLPSSLGLLHSRRDGRPGRDTGGGVTPRRPVSS